MTEVTAGGALSIAGIPLRPNRAIIIAEAGTAHGGDLGKARELIQAARDAGADCVKFQWVIADELVHPRAGAIRLPGGAIPIHERFRAVERPPEFYAVLQEACAAAGVIFLCTPFGPASARALIALGVPALKIASPELNHVGLLRTACAFDGPLILSSGVSRLTDIERALTITGRGRVVLLHCVTAYPAPPEDYNLAALAPLATLLGIPVGISDHSLDATLVPSIGVWAGMAVIEKHITLSRDDPGLDDPIALEPRQFDDMVRAIRATEALAKADGPGTARRALDQQYGADRVKAVIGSGLRELAAAERRFYPTTRRSLLFVRDAPAGACLDESLVQPLRAEQNMQPGLEPALWSELAGARLVRGAESGEPLRWDHVLDYSGNSAK